MKFDRIQGGEPMQFILDVTFSSASQVWATFRNAWPYLLLSAVLAAALRIYLDPERIAGFLSRHQKMGVVGATATAVATPLCSCGTTAVALGMIAYFVPLAPVVSFLASSPLTSPEELIYSAGLFGWRFAWTFWASSIFVGLAAGTVAGVLQWRGALSGQIRTAPKPDAGTSIESCTTGCTDSNPRSARLLLKETFVTGRKLLFMFLCFAFIGYFLNGLIPPAWIKAIFGGGKAYSVLIAATLGFPVYVNSEASLPMIRALIDSGMNPGAALAFLITGAGTSIGAIVGLLTIARWRVIAIVVGTLWASAVLFGTAYNIFF
jgi:uncharacterized membrane protein YraQ (UPF0718 family)